jgi:hypothetical protein
MEGGYSEMSLRFDFQTAETARKRCPRARLDFSYKNQSPLWEESHECEGGDSSNLAWTIFQSTAYDKRNSV